MQDNSPWTPAFSWHTKVILVCLVLCAVLLLAGWQITQRLPAPYQIKRPSPQATVWRGH